jgi:hypothetical protein
VAKPTNDLTVSTRSRRPRGRYLGVAYLVVFVGSALSGALWPPLSSGITAEKLASVGENTTSLRWASVIELFITSVGIVVLATLLYMVLRHQDRLLSRVALGWWIAEAVTLAMSTVGAFLLIPVAEEYAEAGAGAAPHLLGLADVLVRFDRVAWEIHMVFFAVGGLVWYVLMYQSRCVPRWLSVWGFLAVSLGLVSTFALFAADADLFYLGFPTGLFEVVLGVWLIVRGVPQPETATART